MKVNKVFEIGLMSYILFINMSGRVKGCKCLKKDGAKRHRKVLIDNIQGIMKQAI